MKKIEATLLIFCLGVVLVDLLMTFSGAGLITVLSLSFLSMFYLAVSFAIITGAGFSTSFKDELANTSAAHILGAVAFGIVLSLTIAGILFKYQLWNGGDTFLQAGLAGLLLASVIAAVMYTKSKSEYFTRILKRAALFGVVGLAFLLVSADNLIDLKYNKHPDLAQTIKEYRANPDNPELLEKVKLERQKVYDGAHNNKQNLTQ